jgi:hypothetical protein
MTHMDQAQFTLGILTFVVLTLPIIAALWRIFSEREKLAIGITQNHHLLKLQEQHLESMKDQQTLFLNGIVERLNHVRTRSKQEEEQLDRRLLDVESFLEKSTDFTRRRG